MTAQLAPLPVFRGFDNNGNPASFGTLGTFIAGTNTPLATYVDSTLTTQNTNPITLNFRGEANVWLDPTKSYKFVLKDFFGTLLWTVDNITIGNANPSYSIIPITDNLYNLGSPSFSWANIYAKGDLFVGPNLIPLLDPTTGVIGYYPRTPAEIALNVVPVNFSYVSMYVDRYGTNTNPGTTSMVAAFNAACKVAKYASGTAAFSGVVRYGATGTYLLDGPVDCTLSPGQLPSANGFTIRNEGNPLGITFNPPNTGSIIAKHNGHVFDCTGATGIIFENVAVSSDPVTYPKTCWFLARNSTDLASQIIHLKDCRFYGLCSISVVYNFGSENYLQDACTFIQRALDAGCKTCVFTQHNVFSQTSTFQTVAPSPQSTTVISIRDGECQNISGSATSDIIYLEGCSKVTIDGTFLDSAPPSTPIRSLIYVDTTTSPTNTVCLRAITSEAQAHQSTYGLYIGNAAQTCANWVIDGCDLSGLTSRIFANVNVTCDDFYTRCTSSDNSLGNINFAGTLQNSILQEMATNVVINVSTNNVLMMPSNNLTVTTRNADSWIDAGSHTWTPGTGALTHGGVLTPSNKRVEYHGQQITVTLVLSDTVSLSCAAGTAITGLPIAATVGAANVVVANGSTDAVIGVGQVSGTSLILPAISVGAGVPVGITATYFCA